MSDPHIAQKAPYKADVTAGTSYWWCHCGLSAKQPYCDGSHKKERLFSPIEFKAEKTETVYFCGCKRSAKKPLCDGSHKNL